jgi:ubiquinone/menaquinone biosynthesis C-methylase UbiE
MDTSKDALEYDAMNFDEPNLKFALDALAMIEHVAAPEVLDIGAGTARIPILMAERRRDLSILAVDLAAEMIHVGTNNVASAGVGQLVRLQVMDAKALRVPKDHFDLVLCNSTMHHLPDPVVGFREVARVTKPGGVILVRDLARPASMDEAWEIVKRVAPDESRHQKQLFFDSLCAALTLQEVAQAVDKAGLSGLDIRMVSDRHWTAEGKKQK